MNIKEEQNLIKCAKADRHAFGQLFDAYYSQILRYCVRRTASITAAEDITSETFIKAYRNIDKFSWKGVSISAWFYKIATNEIRMYYRNAKHNITSLDELYENTGFEAESDVNLEEDLSNIQLQIDRQTDYRNALSIIQKLPVKYQEVLMLRYVENKKISEIALILNKKEGTVKSLLSRSLKKVRTQLEAGKVQPFEKKVIVISEGQRLSSKEAYERN
jgi:RNA polymerase sigma factor (sigma-70 family)